MARSLPALALGTLLAGCSPRAGVQVLIPNQRPQVVITESPVNRDLAHAAHYVTQLKWSGYDADGRVDRFDYAVDPNGGDTAWMSTRKSEVTLFLGATQQDGSRGPTPKATDFHTVVLRAVDERGAMSPVVHRSFYSYTIAPTVQIMSPTPSHLLMAQVGPTALIRWAGFDPDGERTQKPVHYKFKRLPLDDPSSITWLVDPDSLRRRDSRSGFADWDSVGSDVTSVLYTNQVPGKAFLFALVGYDEAGAYSPVFSLDSNMLVFRTGTGNASAPLIHVFNSYIDYRYPSGGYSTDIQRHVRLELPADQVHEFRWDAAPAAGAFIESYRWVLDAKDLTNETPRDDEEADWDRWSRASNATTSCRLGPFPAGEHYLYIEALDSNGLRSLGIVHFTIVSPRFDKELLIVDDTRPEVDKFLASGCLQPYTKAWPSASELDTFLYARGGYPWRCTVNPASGALSTPGLFAGYSFDTLGTRLGLEDPANAVRLSRLSRYRNVIWMVDPEGALRPDNVGAPTYTTLWAMSRPGYQSALSTYVRMGGRVWLFGGGAAYASLIQYDKARNNRPSVTSFTNLEGELASPLLMHDAARWQSAIAVLRTSAEVRRSAAAERVALAPWTHADGHSHASLTAPDYLRLPPMLRMKSAGTDPIPPTRAADRGNLFYLSALALEVLSASNSIIEDVEPTPEGVRLMTTLDTLFDASGGGLPGPNLPVMTYYHGHEARQFVFSGFSPWIFAREDAQRLVDFVLQDLWRLPRSEVGRSTRPAGASTAGAAAATRVARSGR